MDWFFVLSGLYLVLFFGFTVNARGGLASMILFKGIPGTIGVGNMIYGFQMMGVL